MNRATKDATRNRLIEAATRTVVVPKYEVYPIGACVAMAAAQVSSTIYGRQVKAAFRDLFRPPSAGGYWWHTPSWYKEVGLFTGRTYDPQEARCLALLLMAEMIRTGDV